MTDRESSQSAEGIAIIGMTGRFPGAASVAELWLNLCGARESISFFAEEELVAAGVDPDLVRRLDYVRARGTLRDVERFDAEFFGINPREADIIDPQQRLFLQCAWEAFEQAGYAPLTYRGLAGVFAGVGASSYVFDIHANRELWQSVGGYQIGLGNDKDHLSTRVSYKLNLRGPSVTVQTACSSSLVAVTLACESLLTFQCDLALAGGSSISVPQTSGYLYEEGGILSPDGHCRAFDAAAQGTVSGNGVGVVVLKRLTDAVADGDTISAVIKGWAVNNDGSRKAGFTAPSVDGQAAVIMTAHANAGVTADTIGYVEAHGTGTALGDPVEVAALTQAFRATTDRQGFCALGSVKTNIGHLDAAAGVTGLIKAAMALQHRELPPSLHFSQPNPAIDFANSPFYVQSHLSPWPQGDTPRRAGVSSFGVGGTNAHAVLEEAPTPLATASTRPAHLVLLSAKTGAALQSMTSNLATHFRQQPALPLADVAFTLQEGRCRFPHRRALVAHDLAEAARLLESLPSERVLTTIQELTDRPIAFLFPGQGAQYPAMARGLYEQEPRFREQVDRCCELLSPHLGQDLRRVLFPAEEQSEQAAHALEQTALAQPALFTIEYALAQLWSAWGIRPNAMLGHSIGEYVAACLAGVFTLEEALALVAARGRLLQELPPGAMLAVPLAESELRPLLGPALALAAVNGPALSVVSGPEEAVAELNGRLTAQGLTTTRLRTSHAFHSSMLDPILEAFHQQVKRVRLRAPQLSYISNVTGTWADASVTDPAYWVTHLRQTVRFSDGLAELLQDQERVLLEVGPGTTLSTLARQHPARRSEQAIIAAGRHPRDQQPDLDVLMLALGQLWLAGASLDWAGVAAPERRQRLPLPTYPFERAWHWLTSPDRLAAIPSQTAPDKKPDIADWFYVPLWKQTSLPAANRSDVGSPTRWLLFADTGVGTRLAERLGALGHAVTTVRTGVQYEQLAAQQFRIDPRCREHYQRVLDNLGLPPEAPLQVVHLWSASTLAGTAAVETALDAGFFSVLHLSQALGDRSTGPVRLTVVTDRARAVTGGDLQHPEQATVFGPCMVLPQELPAISCRSVDVAWPVDDDAAQARLADHLLAEVTSEASEPVVAYRGTRRWAQNCEPVRLETPTDRRARLRERGVYVITGGLGGVGLALADHLARTVQARLILVGRSAFPEREQWATWLESHDSEDVVGRKIRRLQALETAGAEVLVVQADVADRHQVDDLLRRALSHFGALHGVIHAAGIAGGGVAQLKTRTMAADVLRPKVQGALALAQALATSRLDFLVLCSSLSSVIGGVGRVDYCGANAFLDAFALQAESVDGTFVVAVNWDTWQDAGMAVEAALPADHQTRQTEALATGMRSTEGADVLSRVLGADLPQVILSTRDLQGRLGLPAVGPASTGTRSGRNGAVPARHARPEQRGAYIAPRSATEQTVAELWQAALGLEQVGLHDDFFESGGHSLLAIQLLSRLRDTFQVELSLDHLFAARTVARLADTIDQQLAATTGETQQIADVLNMVERLSVDELAALLGQPEASSRGGS
jgi:acyl transferase domain-containing protein/acyl carrier protein